MPKNTPRKAISRLWTYQQRVWCVEMYLKNGFNKIREAYRHTFGTEKLPPDQLFSNGFTSLGVMSRTVQNLFKQYEGRQTPCGRPMVRTPGVIATIRESVELAPRRSSRKRSQSLGDAPKISGSTFSRMVQLIIPRISQSGG